MRKLVRKGLHNDVIEEIGKRIVSGEFKPGSPLPSEVALVTILGISRTALREALRVLGAKGLVEAKPKIGTIVQPSSEWNHMDADIFSWRLNSGDVEQVTIELQQMRQIFEPLAASLAAENATADDLAQLTAAYNDMETAADAGAAFVDPDVRFHRGIIAASGNSLFGSLGRVVGAALEIFFRLGVENPRGQSASLMLHKAVLDAIVARNPKAARLAMHKVIEDAEQDASQIRKWKRQGARGDKASAVAPKRLRG